MCNLWKALNFSTITRCSLLCQSASGQAAEFFIVWNIFRTRLIKKGQINWAIVLETQQGSVKITELIGFFVWQYNSFQKCPRTKRSVKSDSLSQNIKRQICEQHASPNKYNRDRFVNNMPCSQNIETDLWTTCLAQQI